MKRTILTSALFVALSCAANAQSVEPMVKTAFSQGVPFNNACPEGTVAGCGPVAIAQILSVYRQPTRGWGQVEYTCPTSKIVVKADFDKMNFDWNNILDSYKSNTYTSTQAEAVAQLVFACGAAVRADYSTSTGTNNYALMLYGMQHHLHISPSSRYLRRSYYSTAEWIELLNSQLRSGHPVLYRGSWLFNGGNSGHIWVIDGVDDQGLYHINFGLAGNADKYADINILNQSGTNPGGRGVCWNASQAMVINCFPTPDESDYPLQTCILEEPIQLNSDASLTSIKLNGNESFTLSCRLRNCSAQTARIRYRWALEKDGKLIKEYTRNENYTLWPGYTFGTADDMQISLPETLEAGSYQLKLYSKSDIVPDWSEVWTNAPTGVTVEVNGNGRTVTVPDSHSGHPRLYLRQAISEIANKFAKVVPGRTFLLALANNTTNNFQGNVRLEVVADGQSFTYDVILPVYSQSKTDYHVLIPQSSVDLSGKTITAVKASYYLDSAGGLIPLTQTEPSSVEMPSGSHSVSANEVRIYTTNGILVKNIRPADVSTVYPSVLKTLPRGIYIIKEGTRSRKIAI